MTSEEHVKFHFPDARTEEQRDLLYHVIVSKNGLGFEESIGSGFMEDWAYEDASEWILLYWECECDLDDEDDDYDDD